MLLTIFHPMNEQFLTDHNGAVITNYWANWDLCNMASVLAIGIFADRDDLVDRAVDYFHNGAGNGSLAHAVPFLYDDGLAQWQESGRDQAHTVMGIGLMGAFCEMAWNQGIDCYGVDDNRFLKGAEYVAKYNLGHDVPFTPYSWQSGPRQRPRPMPAGRRRPCQAPGAGGRADLSGTRSSGTTPVAWDSTPPGSRRSPRASAQTVAVATTDRTPAGTTSWASAPSRSTRPRPPGGSRGCRASTIPTATFSTPVPR